MAEPIQTKPSWWTAFQAEAAAVWREMPHKGFFLGLLGLWLLLFQFLGNSTFGYIDTTSLFSWMYNSYNAELSEDGHGNLIPLVVLGLLWWKREEWRGLVKSTWWPALIGLALGLFLHAVGYIMQQPRLSIVGFFMGLYFLMGLAWGRAWLQKVFFPFVLFVFCIPVGTLAESITFPLRLLVTYISSGISQTFLGIDVIRVGTQLFDAQGTFQYDVAAACSGIRSLISLVALTTIYGFITFQKTWKRLLMVGLALPLAVVGNVVRITSVIVTAEAFGQKAGARVHDGAGFVTFAIAIACIMVLGHYLQEERPVKLAEGSL